MRAEWKHHNKSEEAVVAWVYMQVSTYSGKEWNWRISHSRYGQSFRFGTEPTQAAAKLAAERELRRLIGGAAEAMGGTVQWQPDAARPQEEQ